MKIVPQKPVWAEIESSTLPVLITLPVILLAVALADLVWLRTSFLFWSAVAGFILWVWVLAKTWGRARQLGSWRTALMVKERHLVSGHDYHVIC